MLVHTDRRTTNKLRSLIEKKVRLQDKTEKIKSEFEQAMKQLAQVSQAIQATELEVAEAQRKVQACVKDEEDSPYKDVASYLEKEGIILSEEQAEALKTKMAVKVVETDWSGVLGPREPGMPVEIGMYGPMRMSRDVSVRATPTGRERSPARAHGE